MLSYNYTWTAVFSIRKSLRVLQKTCIKIVARAIYTYLFFSYTCTPVLLEYKKLLQLLFRLQMIAQLNILQDYSTVRSDFNLITGFDLTFKKWFLSFPNKNNHKTDHKFCTPWLVDEENFEIHQICILYWKTYKKELY